MAPVMPVTDGQTGNTKRILTLATHRWLDRSLLRTAVLIQRSISSKWHPPRQVGVTNSINCTKIIFAQHIVRLPTFPRLFSNLSALYFGLTKYSQKDQGARCGV